MRGWVAALLLLLPWCGWAADEEEAFLLDFLAGGYHLIGKVPGGAPYAGTVTLARNGDGLLVIRTVEGRRVEGRGWIDHATADRIAVLRLAWRGEGGEVVATCLMAGDLDNYARLTCTYGERTDPGLEAMFVRHELEEPRPDTPESPPALSPATKGR